MVRSWSLPRTGNPVRPRCHQRRLGYLNNRYYDPSTGEFLSVDPVVTTTGDPYLYAAGNPTTLTDPSGLDPEGFGAISFTHNQYGGWNVDSPWSGYQTNWRNETVSGWSGNGNRMQFAAGSMQATVARQNASCQYEPFMCLAAAYTGQGVDASRAEAAALAVARAHDAANPNGDSWVDSGGVTPDAFDVVSLAVSVVSGGVASGFVDALTAETGAAAFDEAGASALADAAQSCSANSFTGDTPVRLADGSEVAISSIRIGDDVLATDPDTGETEARPVTNVIVHHGPHTMVDVELTDGSALNATDHHPFWDATTDRFVYAIGLRPGDHLRQADGSEISVTAIRVHTEDVTAYNLAVNGIHTYYAGTTPVLVHNSCWGNPSTLADHFERHGGDFGAPSAETYTRLADDFFESRGLYLTKVDPNTGTIRVWDPASNTFGSYSASGATRTFYKPDPALHGYPTNLDYWIGQPG